VITNCPEAICSHSISTRLSRKLAVFTMVVLGVLFTITWGVVKSTLDERNAQDLDQRCQMVEKAIAKAAVDGGEQAVAQRMLANASMRENTRLELWRADGSLLYADPEPTGQTMSPYQKVREFTVAVAGIPGEVLRGQYTVDYADHAAMGQRWAWILAIVTLAAGVLVALGTRWHVKRSLSPLRELESQTRAISARDLDRRLSLTDPAQELLPWIEQFNALMGRLQQAYVQLESFNADVAHELRTPLATLIGETEVALSRERDAGALRETLFSNLEEMQRMSALVNDMLFLSQADRGAVARRGEPVSLAALARQVTEFHEFVLEDAGLTLRIDGDVSMPVDAALFKRALSNLLGNATRYAAKGSTILIGIGPATADASDHVRVTVENAGPAIEPENLPRLFDRFFRADTSRNCSELQHHGLGLAIVAAIARMHAGRPLAESAAGTTRVGFTLAAR
jgi:two-component system heavy metal sensor histidine kinase CusS